MNYFKYSAKSQAPWAVLQPSKCNSYTYTFKTKDPLPRASPAEAAWSSKYRNPISAGSPRVAMQWVTGSHLKAQLNQLKSLQASESRSVVCFLPSIYPISGWLLGCRKEEEPSRRSLLPPWQHLLPQSQLIQSECGQKSLEITWL